MHVYVVTDKLVSVKDLLDHNAVLLVTTTNAQQDNTVETMLAFVLVVHLAETWASVPHVKLQQHQLFQKPQ